MVNVRRALEPFPTSNERNEIAPNAVTCRRRLTGRRQANSPRIVVETSRQPGSGAYASAQVQPRALADETVGARSGSVTETRGEVLHARAAPPSSRFGHAQARRFADALVLLRVRRGSRSRVSRWRGFRGLQSVEMHALRLVRRPGGASEGFPCPRFARASSSIHLPIGAPHAAHDSYSDDNILRRSFNKIHPGPQPAGRRHGGWCPRHRAQRRVPAASGHLGHGDAHFSRSRTAKAQILRTVLVHPRRSARGKVPWIALRGWWIQLFWSCAIVAS